MVSTVTLDAVGDILLDRGVARNIREHGKGYPFQQVRGTLAAADIAFGNLECPLSRSARKLVKSFSFRADPATADCLSSAGMDILSVANNHSMDCGRDGLLDTMQALRARRLRWCGAGRNLAEAAAPTIFRIRGLRIAFIGFCDFVPEGVFLRPDRPTLAMADPYAVRAGVIAARRQADVVVASFHWGIEYRSRPTERQEALARAAVQAGADLVLGHHPHVLQGIEVIPRQGRRRPALVIYSLGNFVFDQGLGRNAQNTQSAILRCYLDRSGVAAAEILPIRLEHYRPAPAGAPDGRAIFNRMSALSKELKTRMRDGQVIMRTADPRNS